MERLNLNPFGSVELIEEFTGAWCGYCPDGAYRVKNLINANDGIRYDERFRINEDVEFFIQKMNTYRFMIRDNQYVTQCYGEDGGSESTIGYDRAEQRYYATMINNKWGYQAMKWNKTRFEFKHHIKGV